MMVDPNIHYSYGAPQGTVIDKKVELKFSIAIKNRFDKYA